MKKLDPCPFCGEVPKGEWKTKGVSLPHLVVRHKKPSGCPLEMSILIFAEDKDAAIEKWNRRFKQ